VTDLSRFTFEVLRQDENFILYRGRSADGSSPILLRSPISQHSAPQNVKRLQVAYALRDELDPPWAVRPIEFANHRDRRVLVMEDPGGVPLDQLLGQPLDLAFSLHIGISLSSAIGQLHRRGIIHKDIKPAHVLVTPDTGQCSLMGFGISSRLPRERQSPEPPEFIDGTLPYMAPEQTGRMNRSVDSRSDLYSFGVLLYEMLTGTLPFIASDPMEWVHCHIARQPVPPSQRVGGVPPAVSATVMKLLAKTAEERYQTAIGVEYDLRRCLEAVGTSFRSSAASRTSRSSSLPPPFPLGAHDISDQLRIPEKLYGRAQEIDTLLASFDRVMASGTAELVLVSGYSGIGKSSVVNELHAVLVPPRGLFASGKFDQYKRDIPYATLAQAFQSLIRPLLSKGEAELRHWRDALREALGPNGLLMVDLVPELKLVIGEQLPVPELPPQDAQRRFQLVFRRFIRVFARPEHPLALFLDDLQWLDAATLDLLEDLLTRSDMKDLMLIGAYRDNEINSAHPLVRKLEAIRQAGAIVHEIVLAPLEREDLGRLIADTLHCEPECVSSLAQLVQEKTAGNPFFVIQFIHALVEEGLLTFDHGGGRWSWDLGRIHDKGYTDNVVDLMIGKVNRLPLETQKALQEFACLGNSADTKTLSAVSETSEEELHSNLWEAVRLEYVRRSEDSYYFGHDRVQESAYSLIPEQLRAEAHLRIGRILRAHTPVDKREERIFEIVNQLNRGTALIKSREEREQVAELNLIAGRRAKASTAYASALKYLVAGAALLGDDRWKRRPKLVFTLELDRAQCEFLTGELAAAEERLTMLSTRATDTVELATVTCLRVDLYTTLDQSDRAVAVCLDYLRHLGFEWTAHPTDDEARDEYERIWKKLGSRPIEELVELPLMSDLASIATLDVLTKVLSPALFTDPNLASLGVCRAVNLSLEHGNSDGSCSAYVWLGMIAGAHFSNYKAGFRFGRLGYELVEKPGLNRFQAHVYMCFGNFIIPWTEHVGRGRDLVRRAFEAANKAGDVCFAAYSCNNLNTNLLAAGDPLVEVQREAERGLAFAKKVRFGFVIDLISVQLALVRTLRGLTPIFGSLNDAEFDETEYERHLTTNPVLALPECWYFVRKAQARFIAGDYGSAADASLRAQQLLWTSPSLFETAEYYFYGALSRLALFDLRSPDEQRQQLEVIVAHHKQLEVWAENCPENFENRAALVGAEIARIQGRDLAAQYLYEQAIRSSNANGFVQNEAIANELAARFYLARGFEKIAYAYLRDARYNYVRWGANGKVRQLDELYPQLKANEQTAAPTSTIRTPIEHLDLAALIKVLQALSGEIVLEKLIDTLIRTVIEQAGAERGLLILSRDTDLRIEAEATTNDNKIMVRLQPTRMTEDTVPESVIHYVVRTGESVILDDALLRAPFLGDRYIRRRGVRSVMCLPLVNQTKLIGLLYLENNLSPNVFTSVRIAALNLLASQAAISLENTRLYRDLQQREARIRRLVDSNVIGIVIWNYQGDLIDANEAFLQMLGYDREDLLSRRISWVDITPLELRERDRQAIEELKATGITQPFQKEYFRKDGTRVPALIGGAMLDTDSDEGVAFVLDLSEQKRAEHERKIAQEAVQKAHADLAHITRVTSLGELTASIAHEINQPLAAIANNAHAGLRFVAAGSENAQDLKEALLDILNGSDRVSKIIVRMRAMARKAPPQMAQLNFADVVTDVLTLIHHDLSRRNVEIELELSGKLSPVLGDRVQLQQVLLNLVMNGVEAMNEVTEGRRKISIRAEPHQYNGGSAVLVSVQDSGSGLEQVDVNRLFEAFYTTKPKGLGMGLAISRSIIEAHGGRLWLASAVGPGATFQFVLPATSECSR
jgi:PAS domain S-box-containing protein